MQEPVRGIGRLTTGGLTLVVTLLLLLQITTASPAIAASIAISPSSGLAGSQATISGSEFLPLIEVDLCWAGDGCSNLGTVTPDATGAISAGISIPSTASGRYTVSACQIGLGCTQTAFDVLPDDSPATSTPTTTPPGSSTTIRTTTTVSTSSSTSSSTTSPPSTTTPVATSAPSTTLAETTTTGPVEVFAASEDVTTTTEAVALPAEIDPPPDEPAPFRLDMTRLRGRIQDSGAEIAGDEVLAGDLGTPVLAGEASAEIPSLKFSADDGSSGFSLPSFGIWFGWLFLVVGSFVVIVTFDERQRRRDG